MIPIFPVLSIVIVGILVICGLLYFGYISYYLTRQPKSPEATMIRKNGIQTLGVPFAALASFALVIALPTATGESLEFKGLGFEFSGPSSQVVLWNFTFLVFNLSIWLTRNRGGDT